jgi:type VI secretion system secreted protein Hcp
MAMFWQEAAVVVVVKALPFLYCSASTQQAIGSRQAGSRQVGGRQCSGTEVQMRRLFVIGALALGLVAVGSGKAYASVRSYMFVLGIPGSATDVDHTDWIEVLSLSQGASTTKKAVTCTDLSIMKNLDQAGPALWAAAAVGQVFQEIRIEVVNNTAVIYDIRLHQARVTSTNTSGSSELPMESVSFSYQSVTLTFNTQDAKGNITPGVPQTIACQ